MKQKKSQMNLEVIMVLFIFLIIVGIGFAIKGKIDSSSAKQSILEQERQNSVTTTQKISFLPEIICTSNSIIEDNCYDLLKLKSMSLILKDEEEGEKKIVNNYFEDFGYANISFEIIFPQTYGELDTEEYRLINTYTFAKKNKEGEIYFDTSYKTYVPITIFNPLTNEYYLGKMIIQIFGYN